MAERTKRGEEEKKQEDEVMLGEPTESTLSSSGTASHPTTTRDKSIDPADDRRAKRNSDRDKKAPRD